MNAALLSAQDATAVARNFADTIVAHHGGVVVAVALVGSLSTGDYVPGRSDIDTVVVLAAGTDPAVAADIERIASERQHQYGVPKGFGVVCVRLDQLRSPYDPDEELAPEVLDLKQRGTILVGRLDLDSVPSPTEADLRAYCQIFVPWLRAERRRADRPANQTPDANINGLMYELRAAVLARTGRYVLNKREVIPALLADDPATPFAAELRLVQGYLLCQHPAPANPWIDRLRDQTEEYVNAVAQWLGGGGGSDAGAGPARGARRPEPPAAAAR